MIFLLSGCLHQAVMPKEEMVLTKEFQLPGMTREQMFDRSETWIYRHLYRMKGQYCFRTGGRVLLCSAEPSTIPAAGRLDAISRRRFRYTISFTVRVEAGDDEMRVTFEDLMVNVPKNYRVARHWNPYEYTGGYSVPVTDRSDFEAAKKALQEFTRQLESYLKKAG